MTMQAARAELELALAGTWAAVGELVLIAVEDQPSAGSLAAADDLAEQIIEIQGDLAGALAALGTGPLAGAPVDLIGAFPVALAGLDAATLRYWQRVRAYEPTALLRDATRRLGGPWLAWRRSVEQSAQRCERPFGQAGAALRVCCQEICTLVRSTPYDQLRRTS